jgi:diaminohydroxyphosphoribosylaminopyrimidine deaminase/5-amino-6-(5-phosphoribosylamino)uracil reductase
MQSADKAFMRRALELAERGRGAVEPNPLVGAVVVRDGQVVGEGWHQRYGEAHAELNALRAAEDAARGATLFVTLEPCCHHGKTPPCTDTILHAGVARVVAALTDPFPQVSGRGLEMLRTAGLDVAEGLGAAEAAEQNAPYLKLLRTGQPYVLAKWAMSLDGKIATRTGDSRWITGEPARRLVHELRGRVDAVLVGIGTVLADDPLLTARPPGPRVAARVILDRQLLLPIDSQLVRTAAEAPVLLFHGPMVEPDRRAALEAVGCECAAVPESARGVDVNAVLTNLGGRRFTNVLVEGGGAVLGSFWDARAVDEVFAFVAPKVIGGEDAPGPVAARGVERLADAMTLWQWSGRVVGDDWLLHARVNPPGGAETRPPL